MRYILNKLSETNRLSILLLFIITTLLCVMMVACRIHYTTRYTFTFLVWNIFLALIPYGISTMVVLYEERIKNRWLLWLPFALWLGFFPNAPYILTDLYHLKHRPEAPFWYDMALILFFAWNGLMLGYASLLDIQSVISKRFGVATGWFVSVGSLFLAGFGIYLGRFLRWNSWDILSSPGALASDISLRVIDPVSYPRTYGVTIIFSVFLVLGYLLLLQFSKAYRAPLGSNEKAIIQ